MVLSAKLWFYTSDIRLLSVSFSWHSLFVHWYCILKKIKGIFKGLSIWQSFSFGFIGKEKQ